MVSTVLCIIYFPRTGVIKPSLKYFDCSVAFQVIFPSIYMFIWFCKQHCRDGGLLKQLCTCWGPSVALVYPKTWFKSQRGKLLCYWPFKAVSSWVMNFVVCGVFFNNLCLLSFRFALWLWWKADLVWLFLIWFFFLYSEIHVYVQYSNLLRSDIQLWNGWQIKIP